MNSLIKHILYLLLIISITSCKSTSTETNHLSIEGYTNLNQIDKAWQEIMKVGGCFVGYDTYSPSIKYYECEESMISTTPWIKFLNSEKTLLNSFLLSKIPSLQQTNAHVCPYHCALEGELAVYCLQHVNEINWYDLSERYKLFINSRKFKNNTSYSFQDYLQDIIRSPKRRKLLIRNWENYINSK